MINNTPVTPSAPPVAPTLAPRPANVGPAFTPNFTAPPEPTPRGDSSAATPRPAHPAPAVDARATFATGGNSEKETETANSEQETATSGDDRWGTGGTSVFGDITFDGANTTAAGGESSTGRVGAVVGVMRATESGNEADTEYQSGLLYAGAGFNSNTTQVGTAEASQTDSVRLQVGGRRVTAEGDGASGMGRRLDGATTTFANGLRPGGN
jgi:hypothetical protein